jgi:pyruvate/2-oxoglutarate dehydrogenase complex dihydrolipoamide dehydrogenase (E3) component
MAQAFKRLGSKVTLVEKGSLMQKDDKEIISLLTSLLQEEGIRIHEQADIMKIEHHHKGVRVHLNSKGQVYQLDGTHLLLCTGRRPNVEELNLEKAGVDYNQDGITTDSRLRTTNRNIYAAGDVTKGVKFTHVCSYHAGIIIKNIIFKIPAKLNYNSLPWVTFTDPELAHTGMNEQQARDKYGDSIKVLKWPLKDNDRAQTEKSIEGMAKCVLRKNGQILGATILSPHAGELITPWILAINEKLKISAFAQMIIPYPTYSELHKRLASSYYADALFSPRTRLLTHLIQKLPF